MAIFTKDQPERLDARTSSSANEAALSIVAIGTRLIGDLESDGIVKIEGSVEGAIRNARQVLIGRQGEVKGNIAAREVVVGGRVEGNITASERVEIQGSSMVQGDIHTKTIVVMEGAKLNGAVHMSEQVAIHNELRISQPALAR
jgi:cytoskeletal protein CcmA (bactofilin family)